LLRAQRLESIGQLASGVAHDLNNILAPIIMLAPLLRMEIRKPEILRLIDILEANSRRGADVVKQILTFARGLKGGKGPVPTRPLLKEVATVVEETFTKAITIEAVIPEDLWTVEGDATLLLQVLMNLSVNARDAMPDGGTLTLAGENIVADAAFVRTTPQARPGPYVVWLVADTGTGISPENLDRIFDPFFTTKEIGKGTGLGLASVVGIVRDHGGFIKVESKLGAGTRFRVYLPALPVQPAVEAEPPTAPPRGRGETILVVDDEEGVRVTTKEILEENGYQVIVAAEGREAEALFAQHAAGIHAVLTDLMMPVMDGIALVRALRQRAPDLKVLATTGVTETAQTTAVRKLGAKVVIRKPFSAHQLLTQLRAVLDDTGVLAPGVSRPPLD
jgi:CheY-like chemotaxis protein